MTQKVIHLTVRKEMMRKKESIAETIDRLQQDINAYRIVHLPKVLSLLIDDLNELLPMLPEEEQKLLIEIFKLLNTALENQDFLLFSDVLEYELLRILKQL